MRMPAWIVQAILYVPARVSLRLKLPEAFVGEENVTGPLLTVTLCALPPEKFHLTFVPLATDTVAPPFLTKKLSPTLTERVAARAGTASAAKATTSASTEASPATFFTGSSDLAEVDGSATKDAVRGRLVPRRGC